MLSKDKLYEILEEIDGKGYKAYKGIENQIYDFNYFQLTIPHVQGDPFATPSKVFINIKQEEAKFPVWLFGKKIRIHAT
ncbi:hypothetical protein U472_11380 [Orenia metallireducens]|uniref:ATPase of the ABC class N-terminal domain-containing protein n=1 Tax=Orenia metallireducens TaxID=1413210 RepID=A0A1C0A8N7_9FIRM|nr:ABC-ATPase domain-containing protein [Orenia metallireducens]OCL26581.1 hypothetical protein U472_11380 [Orenia metallireducens]